VGVRLPALSGLGSALFAAIIECGGPIKSGGLELGLIFVTWSQRMSHSLVDRVSVNWLRCIVESAAVPCYWFVWSRSHCGVGQRKLLMLCFFWLVVDQRSQFIWSICVNIEKEGS
jgi:hypothetical protein